MNKKAKIIMILIAILLVAVLFFIQRPSIIPQITGNERIDKIIFNSHHVKILREEYGPSVLNEDSLINLIHIVKEESNYEIFCEFGPAYETANLNKLYPGELVSLGQIKDCTIETAKAIDEAMKSPGENCRVLITSPYSPRAVLSSLKDYYLVTLKIEEHEITQEWIDKTRGIKCFEPLGDLLGENIAVGFIMGIIDLEDNRIFY